MTKLSVVADVHANAVALSAVLDDCPAVDLLVCAGDIVGYGPHPDACIDLLREHEAVCIQGNHDRVLCAGASFSGAAGAGLDHARATLDDDALTWLGSLPASRTVCDGRLRLCHGHPDDPDRYVYPALYSSGLLADEDVLVLGHTHVQGHARFTVDGRDRLVVNPGSVGQPRDGDPRAAYAVVTLSERRAPTVEERRVAYDVERVVADVRRAGLPESVGTRLRKGR